MAQFAVYGPLDERDLHDDFGYYPMGSNARQPCGPCERRFRDLQPVESRTQIQQQLRIEAGADFAGEDEIVPIEVSDEQCTQTHAGSLRIRVSANNEFLRRFALHLEPVRRATVLVQRSAPLGNHSFPSLAARTLPRLVVRDFRNVRQRSAEW